RAGALAAFVVGTLTFAGGRLGFTLVLLAFFVPSVLLSRLGRDRKRALVDVGKHGARDAMQVLANGGVAALCALAYALTNDFRFAWAFAGAFAAATADTWATEIGTYGAQTPRSILNGRPVAAGLSGGVTLAGTCAEIAGALWIGTVMVALTAASAAASVAEVARHLGRTAGAPASALAVGLPPPLGITALGAAGVVIAVLAIPLGGVIGATLDSVLGATLQELRRCDACKRTCETDPHACGAATRIVRGMPGLSNDVVNAVATAAGALVAFALA
ncbi:MAG TPA: DUF92 domain-containing protein, partial [Candidatus Elarobacter sp.]|nr:DUF92 domain-containing protein [Candidatus Elarobacter sp.]